MGTVTHLPIVPRPIPAGEVATADPVGIETPPRGETAEAYWVEFSTEGDFAALNEATTFLSARGFSYGRLQRGAPVGVMFGDVIISKWRNLSPEDRGDLQGMIIGDNNSMRHGPVKIMLRKNAPSDVVAAFLSSDPPKPIDHDALAKASVEGVDLTDEPTGQPIGRR